MFPFPLPPLRLFEVKIRFTSDSWKPIRGICLKGMGETRGWRILSAALIDVTPKSRRNLKSAAKCARSMSELQLPSFHEVMPEVHTSEKEGGTAARLHCPRRGHTRRRQNPVQRGLCPLPLPNSPSGEFRFPPPPPFAQKRMRQTAQSLISPQRKARHVSAT